VIVRLRSEIGASIDRRGPVLGHHGASPLLVEGPPAAAIVRAASRKRADLLILGTHGRTGVRRMLIGSVAERVVRTAGCPVLTVRPRR
jgi:nucleotide-binding universal stress UspA family protein